MLRRPRGDQRLTVLLFHNGTLFRLGADWEVLLTSPSITAQQEPRAHPDNREDSNRASYCHADNQANTDGIPLIELRSERRAESAGRLGGVAYRTSSNIVPRSRVLLSMRRMYDHKKEEWNIRKRSRMPKRARRCRYLCSEGTCSPNLFNSAWA
jgi:hypothetical protein